MHEHMLYDKAGYTVALVSVAEPNPGVISYGGKLYVKNAMASFTETTLAHGTFRSKE